MLPAGGIEPAAYIESTYLTDSTKRC